MGMIKVHEFTTVDGVVDAPMWTMDYGFSDEFGAAIGEITGSCSGVLLGRTTFEMFAPAWSTRTVADDPGAPFFNDSPKYVVASRPPAVEWAHTTVLDGYDAGAIQQLKDSQDGDLYVSGSATLVRALVADGLVDELHLFVYPLALGSGLRLFPDGTPTAKLRLLASRVFDNGVIQLTYGPPA